jgi:hypothetical protein
MRLATSKGDFGPRPRKRAEAIASDDASVVPDHVAVGGEGDAAIERLHLVERVHEAQQAARTGLALLLRDREQGHGTDVGEKVVTREERSGLAFVEDDVAVAVSRCLEDLEAVVAEIEDVTLREDPVHLHRVLNAPAELRATRVRRELLLGHSPAPEVAHHGATSVRRRQEEVGHQPALDLRGKDLRARDLAQAPSLAEMIRVSMGDEDPFDLLERKAVLFDTSMERFEGFGRLHPGVDQRERRRARLGQDEVAVDVSHRKGRGRRDPAHATEAVPLHEVAGGAGLRHASKVALRGVLHRALRGMARRAPRGHPRRPTTV